MKNILTVLKSLSDETRLRIINLLYEKELCVCDIMEVLQIPQTKTSRHLSYLKNSGIVTVRKQAQWVYYSLSPEGKMKFVQSLVFDHLRQLPQFIADLAKLQQWLKQKTVQCD
jgi:ArsR family transcriptional regulator, arsenate/arsenite/antimonite-responsive transcriptional repressor